jgi:hypothetical protein
MFFNRYRENKWSGLTLKDLSSILFSWLEMFWID